MLEGRGKQIDRVFPESGFAPVAITAHPVFLAGGKMYQRHDKFPAALIVCDLERGAAGRT